MDLSFNSKPLPNRPLDLFNLWFAEYQTTKPKEPTAMIIATADKMGRPSARAVLLKSVDESGFVFFTNYESQKSYDLKENPFIQILFYWESLGRQVRIHGKVEKVSAAESDAYFSTRPYLSQIGAWASNQSKKIADRDVLLKKTEQLKDKYPEGHVPRPPHWGGYRVIPESFEFWVGQSNRLHDRFLYEKDEDHWKISRLSP